MLHITVQVFSFCNSLQPNRTPVSVLFLQQSTAKSYTSQCSLFTIVYSHNYRTHVSVPFLQQSTGKSYTCQCSIFATVYSQIVHMSVFSFCNSLQPNRASVRVLFLQQSTATSYTCQCSLFAIVYSQIVHLSAFSFCNSLQPHRTQLTTFFHTFSSKCTERKRPLLFTHSVLSTQQKRKCESCKYLILFLQSTAKSHTFKCSPLAVVHDKISHI